MSAAQKAAATRKAEHGRNLEKLRAHPVRFRHGRKNVGTLQLGMRAPLHTGWSANANYDEKLGYGFTADVPTQAGDQHWISDPLERDSLRLNPGTRFQFKAAPGRYHLRLSAAPTDGVKPIQVNGAQSGPLSLDVSGDKPLAEADM